MSQRTLHPLPVVCWSPGHLVAYDPVTRQTHSADSAGALAGMLGSGREVIAAISRRNAFVRTARVPNAPHAEVRQVLSLTIGNHIPVAADALAYDFYLTDDVNAEGRLAVIGAAHIDTLAKVHAELGGAGLRVSRILPVAFGAERLAAHAGISHGAVAELTDEGLCVELIADGQVRYSRVVPAPDNAAETAETIARSFAIAGLPPGPVLAAGGLNLPTALNTVERAVEALAADGATIPITLETPDAIAARQRGLEAGRNRIAVVLVLAAIAVGALLYADFSAAAAVASKHEGQFQTGLRKLRAENTSVQARTAAAEKLSLTLQRAFNPAQPFSDVLGVIASKAPEGVWLNGVTLERGKPLLVRATAKQNEAVSAYLDSLRQTQGTAPGSAQQLPRFRDVKLVVANNSTIETTPVVLFSVSAYSIGNLPLVETKGRTR